MKRLGRRLVLLFGSYARVRRRVIAGDGAGLRLDGQGRDDGDEALLKQARDAMPRGYDVDAIYEYPHVDSGAADAWMERQFAQANRFRYLPLLGRDCFTFAKDALQRAGAPVLLWELYLQRGDGAIARLPRRGHQQAGERR